MDYYGIESSVSELAELSGYDENSGTTIHGLLTAAASKGLSVNALKCTSDTIKRISVPFIAHAEKNHYVTVYPQGQNLHLIPDGFSEYNIHSDEFFNYFTKNILLFSATWDNSEPRPRIKFDSHFQNVGDVAAGREVVLSYNLENVGDHDVTIYQIKTSCDCTATSLENKRLSPGSRDAIVVSFTAGAEEGREEKHSIYVLSDDPVRPLVKLSAKARVKPSVIAWPSIINLGCLNPNFEETILIYLRFKEDFSVNSVSCGPGVKQFGEISYAKYNEKFWAIIPILIKDSVDAASYPWINSEVRILIGVKDEIVIPVKGQIASSGYVKPEAVYLRRNKVGEITPGVVFLRAADNVARVHIRHSDQLVSSINNIENDLLEFHLSLAANSEGLVGYIVHVLIESIDGRWEMFEVPVAGYSEKERF